MVQRFTEMLDSDDLDVVIYPVQNNPPPYIGDWSANFGAWQLAASTSDVAKALQLADCAAAMPRTTLSRQGNACQSPHCGGQPAASTSSAFSGCTPKRSDLWKARRRL